MLSFINKCNYHQKNKDTNIVVIIPITPDFSATLPLIYGITAAPNPPQEVIMTAVITKAGDFTFTKNSTVTSEPMHEIRFHYIIL
jgi:hypothetical protein